MEITASKTAYRAPLAKVVFVKAQGVLCQSRLGENTEKFGMSGSSYSDDDWE